MKKIHELLGKKPLNGDVGIEIEAEGEHMKAVDTKYWLTCDDGSLRGRYPDQRAEFVLVNPIPISVVKAAVTELTKLQEAAKINFSFRTSVHVHVNVMELTEKQVLNMVYTYMLLEEPLMNFCGKERKGNRFCLRLQDAEGLLDTVLEFSKKGWKYLPPENQIRYAAVNLGALHKYGSVEFRGMRGTMDVATITTWANALVCLRTFAVNQENPQAIFDLFLDNTPEEFLRLVLGKFADPFVYKKMDKDILRSFSLSIDVPSMYKELVEKENPEEKYLKAELEDGAQEMVFNWAPPGVVNFEIRPAPAPRRRAAQVIIDDLQPAPVA